MDTKSTTPDTPVTANSAQTSPATSNGQRIATLAVGDVLVFLIFAVLGMRSHSEGVTVPSVLLVAAPFIVAWFLVSPFVGAFRRGLEVQPRRMVQRTLLSWVAAWPVALLFRGLIRGEVPPLSFALVTLFTNMLLLLLWRWPYALRIRQRTAK